MLLASKLWAIECLTSKEQATTLASKHKKPLVMFCGKEMSKEKVDQYIQNKQTRDLLELCVVCLEKEGDQAFVLVYAYDHREIARLSEYELLQSSLVQEAIDTIIKDQNLSLVMDTIEKKSNPSSDLEVYYKQALDLQRNKDAEKLLELGLKSEDPFFFLLEKYRLLLDETTLSSELEEVKEKILSIDPENQRLSHLSMAILEFQRTSCLESSSQNKIAPLISYLETHLVDEDTFWRLEMIIAQSLVESDEFEKALLHAKKALIKAPSVRKEEIAHSIESIESYLKAL